MTINENVFFGHMPRYLQIAEIIKQKIANGEYKPHEVLPSEPELGSKYGVSRSVVRQAFGILLRERLTYVVHGSGTFVSEPPERCEHCGQVLPVAKQQSKEVAQ